MTDNVTIAASAGGHVAEMVETIGQQWLLLPDNLEWGLEEYLIVRAGSHRLILCRVERFTRTEGAMPVANGIRRIPTKASELELCEF